MIAYFTAADIDAIEADERILLQQAEGSRDRMIARIEAIIADAGYGRKDAERLLGCYEKALPA